MGLDLTSVLSDVFMVIRVGELVRVDDKWSLTRVDNTGMWGQASVVGLSKFMADPEHSVMVSSEMSILGLPFPAVMACPSMSIRMSNSMID